jgi:hypothetical protein
VLGKDGQWECMTGWVEGIAESGVATKKPPLVGWRQIGKGRDLGDELRVSGAAGGKHAEANQVS